MKKHVMAFCVVALIGAGCSQAAVDASTRPTPPAPQPPTTPPSFVSTAAPTPSPTDEANEFTPETSAPASDAEVVIVRTYMKRWTDSIDTPHAQVIVEVKNEGGGWADLRSGSSDYTIYAPDGSVTATGSFLYVFPRYVGPGKSGYLADETIGDEGQRVAEFDEPDANVQYEAIDEPGTILTVSRLKLKRDAYGDGINATGIVTNKGTDTADSVAVGVFYLDAGARVLGYSYTNLVENLRAKQSKGFETLSGPPLRMSTIKKAVGYASDYGY